MSRRIAMSGLVSLLGLAGRSKKGLERQAGNKDADPRTHRVRAQILDILREQPGMNLSELRQATKAGWGTIQHHTQLLVRAHLIRNIAEGRTRRFFLAGEDKQAMAAVAALRRGRMLEMAETIVQHPGEAQSALLTRLGMSRRTFRTYANILGSAGLVQEIRKASQRRYFPTHLLAQAVARTGAENTR